MRKWESGVRWAALWRSDNELDGKREHIMFDQLMPKLFHTRQQARDWIAERYGYIKERPDLRGEPHGWKMPVPVRVKVQLAFQRSGLNLYPPRGRMLTER